MSDILKVSKVDGKRKFAALEDDSDIINVLTGIGVSRLRFSICFVLNSMLRTEFPPTHAFEVGNHGFDNADRATEGAGQGASRHLPP